jgi:ligand-binding sensor protein
MRSESELSEAARWFLGELKRMLITFSDAEGIQVFILNKDGDLVNEIYPVQKVCKTILAQEAGVMRCQDHFRSALNFVKIQKKYMVSECYAGFVSVWVPVVIRDVVIGVIIACGKKRETGETKDGLRKKFSKLADELGIIFKEEFLKNGVDDVPVVYEEDVDKRIKRIEELIVILTQSANTPLKEVLG